MTNQEQYEKCLARAVAEKVNVISTGTTSNGLSMWRVNSGTTDAEYLVIQLDNGHMACTCQAGEDGTPCKHRAVTKHYRQVAAQAVAQVEAEQAERAANDDERQRRYAASIAKSATRIQRNDALRTQRSQENHARRVAEVAEIVSWVQPSAAHPFRAVPPEK